MIAKDGVLIITRADISNMLRACLSQYLFMNRNQPPTKIIVMRSNSYKFQYDAISPEQVIPLEFAEPTDPVVGAKISGSDITQTTDTSIPAKKSKVVKDATNRHSRTGGNRKTTKSVSSSSTEESEPEQ